MHAPGSPGLSPTWCSSAKDMVGCALGPSRLWFTIGHGIVNEVYYPRADIPQIRDLGFIVADGSGFCVEVKRLQQYRVKLPAPGIPAIEIVHTHARFVLRIRVAPDAERDVLLLEVALSGDETLRPYVLLAPHLGGSGRDNTAEAAQYRGRRFLWARQGPYALALAAADTKQLDAMGRSSAGYVGTSDGWQDFAHHGRMTWAHDCAGPGNVALTGELPRCATLALGFGSSCESAATLAASALAQPFSAVWEQQVADWRDWHGRLTLPKELPAPLHAHLSMSAMVLRVHQDKTYPGAMVASLSVPWGNGRDDIGGYHLVWPRDLVESAGALLAIGATAEVRDVLRYLVATQQADGHWSQNQWLGGKPYWHGNQLDETAFPVLLASAMFDRNELDGMEVKEMVRRALSQIASMGPASDQDRWEEDAGINAFTLAVCIAALVCGARFLDEAARNFALLLADYWNSRIEEWTTATDTELARSSGVPRHYIRIAPAGVGIRDADLTLVLPIRNHERDPSVAADEQVSVDFLQLVRFGLRDAHDPLVIDTLKIVDRELKCETPYGPAWHRFTGDGYGELADGSGFAGAGQGRAWPLLSGERGHYVVAAGGDPLPFLQSMAAMTGTAGLMPEQVWDAEPLPTRNLFPGKPTGAAMPLVWSHAEFIKLAASRELRYPFDRPPPVWLRYGGQRPVVDYTIWTKQVPVRAMVAGHTLHLCLPERAQVHIGHNDWCDVSDLVTTDTGLGVHVVTFGTGRLKPGDCINFTMLWLDSSKWQDVDYAVRLA